MKKIVYIFLISLMLLSACVNTYQLDSYEEISISFSKDYEEGDKKGYEEGKNRISDHIRTLFPLQESYTQYDLGYINGYYVGCHETEADCANVDELVDKILRDNTGKYDIQTGN